MRRIMLVIVAIAAVGLAAQSTDAWARGGWHGHGGWHGGWHRGWRGGWGYFAYPYYGPYYYAPYYYGGCYRVRSVLTPYGWRWRRVWVCW